MTKKILVTGSNGQVGRALQAIARDYEYDFQCMNRHELDITNKAEVENHLHEKAYDFVINCAAYTAVDLAEENSDLCYAVNATGVQNLAEACASLAPKTPLFIHLSSDYVYHPEHNHMMDETEPQNPQSVYAKSKLAGEKAAVYAHGQTIILRTSWVYAKAGNNFVNTMKKLSAERDLLKVVNDQHGSPTFAHDIASTIMELVLLHDEGATITGTYNYCNAGITHWHNFAEEIRDICLHTCEIQGIPSSEYPTAAKRPLNSRMNTEKIQSVLNHPIRHWKDALKECLQ